MTKTFKKRDKKTGAKIRVFHFSVPYSFYRIMKEKAELKGMTLFENNKSYLHFLPVNLKYYKIIDIVVESALNDYTTIIFTFEKLTNKKSLYEKRDIKDFGSNA